MKKLLAVLLVLAFAAVPAMADDALDVSGSMRIEAYSISNEAFNDDDARDRQNWDQRFRLQLKMQPADGVMAVFRSDLNETQWSGSSDQGSSGARPSFGTAGEMMIDRAYLSVDRGMVNVTGGRNAYNLGMGHAYNNQDTGVQLTIKTPLAIRIGFVKESETNFGTDDPATTHDETLSDDQDLGTEDIDQYYVDFGFKTDAFGINLFYAMQVDGDEDRAEEPTLLGAMGSFAIGPVNVKAEIDLFGGSAGSGAAERDYTGMQFYADASMALSDMLTVGADFVYSDGNDSTDETKIVGMPRAVFGDYIYTDNRLGGPNPGEMEPLDNDIFSVDPEDADAGALGIGPYIVYKPIADLEIGAGIRYLMGNEDIDTVDNMLIYQVGVTWAMAPSTQLQLQYVGINLDADDDYAGEYEDYSGVGLVLAVDF